MTSLFFYGTLRFEPLLEIVLGKPVSQLEISSAQLPGYAVQNVAEGPFPGIVKNPDAVIAGILVTGLTAQDLDRLDFYEGGFDYALTEVSLRDGQTAQTFIAPEGAWTLHGVWHLNDWVRDWGEMTLFAAREVMGYFGLKSRDEIAAMFPMIRTRAMAQVNAARSHHGAGTLFGKVEVHQRKRSYAKFFAVDDFQVQHERFDGTMTPVLDRAVFVVGDAAIILPYDPVRDVVLVIEQMRMGPLARGDRAVWQYEAIAGRLDAGEEPADAARREAREEANLHLRDVRPVAEAYASPGATSEFYYVFVGLTDLPDSSAGVGGLLSEAEDIRSHILSFETLMAMCDNREAANTPLILAAYWLARHRATLRATA
ncbi:MAG: gamma-glutamylcyclotransferase [Sulfitobacter sp.]